MELDRKVSLSTLKNVFKDSDYIEIHGPSLKCPSSAVAAAGKDKISVGQIKNDQTVDNGYWIWAAADNLTRGSALNAVEICRKVLEMLA